jgi:NADH-quinone oxidoreductase subunit J
VTLFWVLAIGLIATAVFTVSQRSPVYSVVGLLANFVVLATLYLTLDAEFIFVIQIIVYAGAILVLFVFVINLLSSGTGPFSEGPNRMPRALVPAILIALAGFGFLVYGLARGPLGLLPPHVATSQAGEVGQAGVFGSVADFGTALFSTHLLPFEITAFILMVAVIGVVVLAGDAAPAPTRGHHQRRRTQKREPILRQAQDKAER